MASLVACIVTNVSWCLCSACSSVLCACCAIGSNTTNPPRVTSGRKRSVFLLFVSICLSLLYQYWLSDFILDTDQLVSTNKVLSTNYLHDTWINGCEQYANKNNDNDDNILLKRCVSINGNFRVSAMTTLFFIVAFLICLLVRPTFNRELWSVKLILYFLAVLVTIAIPNEPYFMNVYLNIARVGGVLFIFVQQFIILDVAYNWNDKWVDNANKAESEQIKNKWLGAILFSCIVLFAVSIVSIVLLFVYYTGCTTNNTFISLTLVFCILLTMTQLSGEEGNLLSSACISAWSIFLCYSAVSKNPNDSCNPTVGNNNDYIAITIGIVITIISLCWTGWSWTAEDKLNFQQPTATTTDDADDHNNVYGCCHEDGTNTNNQNTNAAPVTGIVVGDSIGNKDNTTDSTNPQQQQVLDGNSAPDHPVSSSNTWRLNIALAMVSCWTSMVLTDWGSIQSDGTISNASTGRIAMWMIMTAQWIALTLYIWSLMAPRLFPDRDFS